MSVLIKDMEMPNVCVFCFMDESKCKLHGSVNNIWREKHPDCPLVEIPTPHGRLIDADELSKQKYENIWTNRLVINADDLEDAPTVIEAEGSEE